MFSLTPAPVLHDLTSERAPEFISDAWSSARPFVAQNSGRVADLATLPAFLDLAALSAAHRGGSIVAQRRKPTGEPDAIPISSDQVPQFLEAGYTIVFERLNDTISQIGELCAELASAFGFSPERAACNLFMTPRGGGIYKHFDDKDVWVIGVRGEKVFTIAENHEFPNPTMNSMDSSADWRRIHPLEFSAEMPPTASTVSVRPGTTLYLPPGYWHATSSPSGAWTLSLGMRRPSWRDLVVSYLSTELLADPEWRAFVPAVAAASEPALARRLEDLAQRIRRWAPSNVLNALTRRGTAALDPGLKIALSSVATIDVTDDGVLLRAADSETLIECDETICALVAHVRDAAAPVSFDDLLLSSTISREELAIAVQGLTQAGVFEAK